MKYTWEFNDGGRSTSGGFIGFCGDCVTRAVSIISGRPYKDVYKDIGEVTNNTPRNGVRLMALQTYLESLGWVWHVHECTAEDLPESFFRSPKVLRVRTTSSSHAVAVANGCIYDTWDCLDDGCVVFGWFEPPAGTVVDVSRGRTSEGQEEVEKVLRRLRAMNRTAINAASTEGEQRNAVRMMQTLMLKHNLREEDLSESDVMQVTMIKCPVNGAKILLWEAMLAGFITRNMFQDVQMYTSMSGRRRVFCFYGPRQETENCVAMFRELMLTIASNARFLYGGFTRGSGASYCEGFVRGLPTASYGEVSREHALVAQERTLSTHRLAGEWLRNEVGVRLSTSHRRGRSGYDAEAASNGRADGAKQSLVRSGTLKICGK